MASARTVMEAAKHMPNKMCTFTVLDAADKRNYLATAKVSKLQASPNAPISFKRPGAKIVSPGGFLPWEMKGKIASAVKFKKN